MRRTYAVLAWVIAAGVFVQAMAVAFGSVGGSLHPGRRRRRQGSRGEPDGRLHRRHRLPDPRDRRRDGHPARRARARRRLVLREDPRRPEVGSDPPRLSSSSRSWLATRSRTCRTSGPARGQRARRAARSVHAARRGRAVDRSAVEPHRPVSRPEVGRRVVAIGFAAAGAVGPRTARLVLDASGRVLGTRDGHDTATTPRVREAVVDVAVAHRGPGAAGRRPGRLVAQGGRSPTCRAGDPSRATRSTARHRVRRSGRARASSSR